MTGLAAQTCSGARKHSLSDIIQLFYIRSESRGQRGSQREETLGLEIQPPQSGAPQSTQEKMAVVVCQRLRLMLTANPCVCHMPGFRWSTSCLSPVTAGGAGRVGWMAPYSRTSSSGLMDPDVLCVCAAPLPSLS